MILLLAVLLATEPTDRRTPQQRFDACVKLTDTDPAGAAKQAATWAGDSGGVPAAQCLGIARSAAGNWKGAADAFVTAAGLADQIHDARAPALWASAGNAALAGGDAARANAALTTAIASPTMPDQMKGEAYLDRARANVLANDLPSARADMNEALRLVPADPMAWLLSATLARRMNDGTRAATDIQEAQARSPNEADILYESGNIAAAANDMAKARIQWAKAVTANPTSDAAERARAELLANGGVPPKAVPQGR